MTLEHSARVAEARKILAAFRRAKADETVPFDAAGWAGRLAAAVELLLEADDPAKVEQARLLGIADEAIEALLDVALKSDLAAACPGCADLLRTQAERLRDRLGPKPGERS